MGSPTHREQAHRRAHTLNALTIPSSSLISAALCWAATMGISQLARKPLSFLHSLSGVSGAAATLSSWQEGAALGRSGSLPYPKGTSSRNRTTETDSAAASGPEASDCPLPAFVPGMAGVPPSGAQQFLLWGRVCGGGTSAGLSCGSHSILGASGTSWGTGR